MSDPYEGRLVRGIAPLARDENSAAGVRFAEAGIDAPEDCLTAPSQLPDAEICIQLFPDGAAMAAWIAGALEFAGNAVSIIPDASGSPYALVVRHDRPRPSGVTLDEVVMLRERIGAEPSIGAVPPKIAQAFARQRERAVERRQEAEQRQDWKRAWAAERAFVENTEGLGTYGAGGSLDEPFDFHTQSEDGFADQQFRLVREAGQLWLGFSLLCSKTDEDLHERWRLQRDAIGLASFPNSWFGAKVGQLDADALSRVKQMRLDWIAANEAIDAAQGARDAVRRAKADNRVLKVVQRVASGCLVAHDGTGSPAEQLSFRTGGVVAVPRVVLMRAIEQGLLTRIPFPQSASAGYRTPGFYGLTKTGRVLAEARYEAAVETILDDMARAEEEFQSGREAAPPTALHFVEAFAAAVGYLSEKAQTALRAAAAVKIGYLEDRSVKGVIRCFAVEHGWLLLAAGAAAGLVIPGARADAFDVKNLEADQTPKLG